MMTQNVKHILKCFESIGRGNPSLIKASHDEMNFGSGGTTLELDGLRIHVVNDRATETVEVGFKFKDHESSEVHSALIDYVDELGKPTCPLEFLAIMKGWLAEEDWLQHYELNGAPREYNEETPPPGPIYELADAVGVLKDEAKWNALIEISEDHEMQMAAGSVAESLQQKFVDSMRSEM